jgi:hypothetical protein
MSISFSCLFLDLSFHLLFIIISFISLENRKKNQIEPIYFILCCLCVRVFLKETSVENKTRSKRKRRIWNSLYVFFLFMCFFFGSRFLCRLFFVSCCCVPKLCLLFFFYAATITAAAVVSLYLFIKRLCVCISFYYLLCVRAGHSFYFVVLSLSLFFFVY